MRALITPNSFLPARTAHIITVVWAATLLFFWSAFDTHALPSPIGIIQSIPNLYKSGIITDILASLTLSVEALILSAGLSLTLAYASTIQIFRPIAHFVAKMRFLGLTGLSFLFGMILIGHSLKLGLLVFGMTVFLSTSLISVIESIASEQIDYARTLRMSELRVFYEVVVLGTLDKAIECVRQNAAISWMMLTMVEGLVRSEGGIGAVLLNQNKHFNIDAVFAIQILILAIGLAQDKVINLFRVFICPYSNMRTSRT